MFNNPDLESRLLKAKQTCDDAADKMKKAAHVFTKSHPRKISGGHSIADATPNTPIAQDIHSNKSDEENTEN